METSLVLILDSNQFLKNHPIIHLPNRLDRAGITLTDRVRVHIDRGGRHRMPDQIGTVTISTPLEIIRVMNMCRRKSKRLDLLRHTFATRVIAAGIDILVLSKILGHAQTSMTLNKYGHVLPNHKRASMEKIRATLY